MSNRFALVVPALNEQEAIAGTLRRCLDARQHVVEQTSIDEMIIVFVNDGSTDRTQEIVDQPEFDDVVKVRFEKNRGYGAAIKAGWNATDAELVGFIDGDGTCEPTFCANLLNEMDEHEADVVLAARLAPDTEMPLIRKIGNRLFAGLLGMVSGKDLTDSASGFRIVRREKLNLMAPLPDGLHFTPAMSCICLLDPRLRIHEVHGMHYKEREGRSKLSVFKDGLRFLYTILFSACCYSPIKTMLAFSLLGALLLSVVTGVIGWLAGSSLMAPMMTLVGGLLVIQALAAGVVAHQLNYLLIGPRRRVGPLETALQNLLDYRKLIVGGAGATVTLGLVMLILSAAQANVGLWTYVALILLTVAAATAALGGVIVRVTWAVGEKQKAVLDGEYELKPYQRYRTPPIDRTAPGKADPAQAPAP